MDVQPFQVHIPESTLKDLRQRLARTRWSGEIPGSQWDYGANLDYVKELVDYWASEFDWRAQEQAINTFDHFRAKVEDIDVHFIHQRGRGSYPAYNHPRMAQLLRRDAEDYSPADRPSQSRGSRRGFLQRGGAIHARIRVLLTAGPTRHERIQGG